MLSLFRECTNQERSWKKLRPNPNESVKFITVLCHGWMNTRDTVGWILEAPEHHIAAAAAAIKMPVGATSYVQRLSVSTEMLYELYTIPS